MIQSGTNLADFIPRRLAWGIVIAVLAAITIFALPNMKFGSAAKRELNLADRNTYMQMVGLTKTEIQQKFGPPKRIDDVKNALYYDIPDNENDSSKIYTWVEISFDKTDHCTSFKVGD